MSRAAAAGPRPPSAPRRPPLKHRPTQLLTAHPPQGESPARSSQLFASLMAGHLTELPEKSAKTVRVFVSSTFSDMHTERNVLMQQVYPKLKEFCRENYGLEFQIVDMRWGIQEEASLDHMASQICFNEILNCQRVSTGPYFVGILGNRYGSRELPLEVPQAQMPSLEAAMAARGLKAELQLLRKWYRLDENQLPPVHVLQPILAGAEDAEARDAALATWEEESSALKAAVHGCVGDCVAAGEMSDDEALRFTASVTHLELQLGLVLAREERRRDALLVLREIEDVAQRLRAGDAAVRRFVDTDADPQATELLLRLKESQLVGLLPATNSATHRVSFDCVAGRDAASRRSYERRLQRGLQQQLQRLVERAVSGRSALEADSLYAEVLQHAHQCAGYVQQFQGRERLMLSLRDYVSGDSRRPLVIHGQSGCGKTSVLARAGTLARSWLPAADQPDAVVAVRFLGTSPGSSGVRQTLKLLCEQLAVFLDPAEAELLAFVDEMKDVVDAFYRLLRLLAETRKVVLLLDSLDQLDSSDGAHHLTWLRHELPENVKLIVSTLPDLFGILDSLRSVLPAACFVEVQPLEPQLCSEIVQLLLRARGRRLTAAQWRIVNAAFLRCSLPIYMNLVYHQVAGWRSHAAVGPDAIEPTVRGAIFELLERLRRKYGRVLVSHALSYITASRSGLSEVELEDLLSLDEDVLGEVFAHHLPPFIRIPPLCWTRIRQEIGSYLVEREADAARVLFWYHRQFWEVANDFLFADTEHARSTHSRMADYFLGEWSGRQKPFSCPEAIANKLKRQGQPVPTAAERQVAAQPLLLQRGADGSRRFNLRRLNELPYHLVRSCRFRDFERHVAFSAEFLESKLAGTSRHLLLRDLQLYLEADESLRGSDQSVEWLHNAVRIAALSLNHSSLSLGVDICGRLRGFARQSASIRRLIDDFRTTDAAHRPLRLLPLNACFDSGSGFTHCTIQVQLSVGKLCEAGSFYVASVSSNQVTWFDFEGNALKTVACEKLVFPHLRYVRQLPASGCCLSVLKERLHSGDLQHSLWQGNLGTGVWRVLVQKLPECIPAKFLSDDNCVAGAEQHLVLCENAYSHRGNMDYLVVKASPLRIRKIVSFGKSEQLHCPNDDFVFFVGAVSPATADGEDEESVKELLDWSSEVGEYRPQVLLLNSFRAVELSCPEIDFNDSSWRWKNSSCFAVDRRLLLVTATSFDSGADGGKAKKLTFHLFAVEADAVSEEATAETAEMDANCGKFVSCVARDDRTAAVLFDAERRGSVGFLWQIDSQRLVPVAHHPTFLQSYSLEVSADVEFFSPIVNLSDDGRVLLAKARSAFFNVWSGVDGTFLRTVPGSVDFIVLGQPRGTDFFLINCLPESHGNSSLIQIKVFDFRRLTGDSGSFEADSITSREEAVGMIVLNQDRSKLIGCHFDEQLARGRVLSVDIRTGAAASEISEVPSLKESDEDNSNHSGSGEKYDMLSSSSGSEDEGEASEEEMAPTSKQRKSRKEIDSDRRNFVDDWKEKIKDWLLYTDLQHLGLFLHLIPGSFLFRLSDNASDEQSKASFDCSGVQLLMQVEEPSAFAESLQTALSSADLSLAITNHAATRCWPIEAAMWPGHPLGAKQKNVCQSVLLGDQLHVLFSERSLAKLGWSSYQRTRSGLIACLDLGSRRVARATVAEAAEVGSEFCEAAARAVRLQALRQAMDNCAFAEGNLRATQFETAAELHQRRETLQFVKKFLQELVPRIEASADSAPSEDDIDEELEARLRDWPALADKQKQVKETFDEVSPDDSLKFDNDSACVCCSLYARPQHPQHLVLHLLCKKVNTAKEASESDCLCWPGQLAVLHADSYRLVSRSRTFDTGTLCLLADGLHCVTYRLKVFRIDTGDLVRDLDPSGSLFLTEIVLTPNCEMLVAKKLEVVGKVRMLSLGDDNSSVDMEDFDDPSKVVQAYDLATGQLLLNHLFEAEPSRLVVPTADRLLLVLREHPVQVFEILRAGTEPRPAAEYLQLPYLADLRKALGQALAQVADVRPRDPIEFMAQQLLRSRDAAV